MWHELKGYMRREVKPTTKQQLIDGTLAFWETVTVEKCHKYIIHRKKVIPRVIELERELQRDPKVSYHCYFDHINFMLS